MLKRFAALLGVVFAFACALPVGGVGVITANRPVHILPIAAADWQLPEGNYQESDLTFSLAYPPSSAAVWAYHLRMQDGVAREIPLGILGGCPPWHVTINDAPPSSTVNNDYYSTGAALALSVPAQSVGTYDVDLTIEDQCGNTPLNPTWQIGVIDADDTDYFVHVTAGASGGGDGSSSTPFDSLADVLGPNVSDTTHVDKQVIICGTHVLSGLAAGYSSNGARLRLNNNKPHVFVACGSGATLRGSASNADGAALNAEAGNDFAFVGFAWNNPLVDEIAGAGDPGLRNVFIHGLSAGGLVFDNSFDCTSVPEGEDDGSNPAVVFMNAGTPTDLNAGILGNTFDDCDDMELVMNFNSNRMAISHNIVTGSAATQMFFLKGGATIENIGFYFNKSTGSEGPFATIQSINDGPPFVRGADFMHNTHVSSGQCVRLRSSTGSAYSIGSRRNSWKCDYHTFEASNLTTGTFAQEADSFEHDGSQTTPHVGVDDDGAGATISATDMDIGTSGILDDTTGLQEGGPDCTHGAEICAD